MDRKNKRQKARKNGQKKALRVMHPPPWSPNIVGTRKIRFQATAASGSPFSTVTFTNLQGLMTTAILTTQVYSMIYAAKIKLIEIWGPPSSSLAPVTVMVKYPAITNSSVSSPEVVHSDTSVGATVPAYVRSKPPKNSIVSMWLSQGDTLTLFQLSFPLNAIVDFTFQYQMAFNPPSTALPSIGVTGATLGQLYCLPLDATPSTGVLVPVGLSTLT